MSEVTSNQVGLEVTFEPDGRRVCVTEPMTLYQAARLAGIDLETPCGGLGICGKCKVELVKGHSEITADERRLLTEHELSKGIRLACRHQVTEETIAYIPDATRSLVQQILASGASRRVGLNPAVRKVHLRVPSPSLTDQRSDLTRLKDAMAHGEWRTANCELELEWLRELPSILRAADGEVTAVLSQPSVLNPQPLTLIALEPGDTSTQCFGMAFDIGTTTVVGYLMDLNTGHEVAVASAMNAQTAYGDDLVSRIKHAVESEHGRKQLRAAVLKVVNDLIDEATQSAGVSPQQIYETVVVGNTCMTHLFLGIDPAPLGFAPYVPVVQQAVRVPARQLGVKMNPRGFVHVLPNIASFVGADTVAVLVTLWEKLGMAEDERQETAGNDGEHLSSPVVSRRCLTSLVVDIGTNGEIVLCHGGRLLACSAAAGPAFEGARISCGMRSAPGAISSVRLNETVEYTTIDERPPRGLCGSGLIDAVAQMLEVGILEPSGRMVTADEVGVGVPANPTSHLNGDLRQRLITVANERQFVLAFAEESATGKPITLSQRDVRQLQLAKGSLCAAIRTLLKIAGVAPQDIDAVYLAGAFGTYLSKESALRIGLLPPEIPPDRIHPVGNAAGAGAKLALLSLEERQLADVIAQHVEHIELCISPEYADTFMETMAFPER